MKARRVVLTVEVETDLPLAVIRSAYEAGLCGRKFVHWATILQISANVIRSQAKKKGRIR